MKVAKERGEVEEEDDEGEEGRGGNGGIVVWVPGSVIRAHAVLGTDREKPVLGRVSRAAHVQLGIVDNGRKRTVRRDGASPLVSLFLSLYLSSFVFLFSPFSHRYPGGTRISRRRERIRSLVRSDPSSR